VQFFAMWIIIIPELILRFFCIHMLSVSVHGA
jgi:hypothetical protein